MVIFKIVFVIIGTLIGAGFASGQEVSIFFFDYGIKGIIGIILASIIIGTIIYKSFKIIKNNKIENYKDFLQYITKNEKIENTVNIIVNIFLLIAFYIMVAGFGAYLKQEYNLNSIVGSTFFSILCFIILKNNVKGLVKTNEILIPFLITSIIIVRNNKYEEYKF